MNIISTKIKTVTKQKEKYSLSCHLEVLYLLAYTPT